MYQRIYESFESVINNGELGRPKVIRIYKTEPIDPSGSIDKKSALRATLYSDLKFLIKQLGGITQFYVKSVNQTNLIVIFKHTLGGCLSHIAVNMPVNGNDAPVFRVEVAGDEGLAEYDGGKASVVTFGGGGAVYTYPDYAVLGDIMDKDCDYEVNTLLDNILADQFKEA